MQGFIIASGVHITDSTLISGCFVDKGASWTSTIQPWIGVFLKLPGIHGEATANFAGHYGVTTSQAF